MWERQDILAVAPFATSDERRKFRANKRFIFKKICPGRLIGNECCRIYNFGFSGFSGFSYNSTRDAVRQIQSPRNGP